MFLRTQRLLLEEKLAKISDFCLMRWKPSYYTSSTANAVPLPLKGKAFSVGKSYASIVDDEKRLLSSGANTDKMGIKIPLPVS